MRQLEVPHLYVQNRKNEVNWLECRVRRTTCISNAQMKKKLTQSADAYIIWWKIIHVAYPNWKLYAVQMFILATLLFRWARSQYFVDGAWDFEFSILLNYSGSELCSRIRYVTNRDREYSDIFHLNSP